MNQAYICSPVRTPIGSFMGSLAALSATELGAACVKEVLSRSGAPAETINEVIMGNVLSAGLGQAPARQVGIKAGLPKHVQALTINKVCSSGLKAVMLAAQSIATGQSEAVIAGGMESMTNAPYYLPKFRLGARLGHASAEDAIIRDGLWDVYNDFHMGSAAELCAKEHQVSREEQDAFAVESYRRAQAAIANGFFKDEILSLTVGTGPKATTVATDEEPSKVNFDKIPTLKAVFNKVEGQIEGTVTAANASSINDGASAMLVCSESYLKKHNLTPMARIVQYGTHAQEPEWFTTAPIGAVETVLKQAKLDTQQIDLFELNEAFSVVAVACSRGLKLDPAKVNINGGAVALGHPIGASGARILTTLLYALKRTQGRTGIASLCNGGGEATAMIVTLV
ncbi:thiolase family protein [bacterium]|nr:thiolase family protein [bacterium]